MAEEAAVKTSVKNCQASNGNNNVSSHSPSINCMQNIKEQIPKYQVMFSCLYLSILLDNFVYTSLNLNALND